MSKLIKGSLSQVAEITNQTLATTFMSCDVLLIVDMSSSMSTKDARGKKSRYDVAEKEVIRLQGKYPGKIGLIVFGNTVEFCPTGLPIRLGGGTDLCKVLNYIKHADDCGMQFILISDGQPDNPYAALSIAKMFISKIDTIYIGDETDTFGGKAFLAKLSAITGGQSITNNQPGSLLKSVEKLLISA